MNGLKLDMGLSPMCWDGPFQAHDPMNSDVYVCVCGGGASRITLSKQMTTAIAHYV